MKNIKKKSVIDLTPLTNSELGSVSGGSGFFCAIILAREAKKIHDSNPEIYNKAKNVVKNVVKYVPWKYTR